MLFVRNYWLGGRRHAAPIRVELHGSQQRAPQQQQQTRQGRCRWKDPASDVAPARCAVHVVAGLLDNYSYIVVEQRATGPLRCVVVDPGDAEAVLNALTELREQHYGFAHDGSPRGDGSRVAAVLVVGVLVTHHHWDHQAGVRRVLQKEGPVTLRAKALLERDSTPLDPRVLWASPGRIAVVGGVEINHWFGASPPNFRNL